MWGCITLFWPSPFGSQNLRHQHGGRTSVSCLRNHLGTVAQGPHGQNFVRFQLFLVFLIRCTSSLDLNGKKSLKAKPQIQRIVQTHNKSIVRDHFPIPGVLGDSRMKERVKYLQSMFSTLLLVGSAGKSIQHLE